MQLIREDLAVNATAQQVPNVDYAPYPTPPENRSGYCWQMWRNPPGGYRFDGAMGQYGIVIPEMDMVIAMTANEHMSYDVLALLWDMIVRNTYQCPLEEAPDDFARLNGLMGSLDLAVTGSFDREADGVWNLGGPLFGVEKLEFSQDGDRITLTTDSAGEVTFTAGGGWTECTMPFHTGDLEPIPGHDLPHEGKFDVRRAVVSAGWVGNNVLEVCFRSPAWMGGWFFRFEFKDGRLLVSAEASESANVRRRLAAASGPGHPMSESWMSEPVTAEGVPAE